MATQKRGSPNREHGAGGLKVPPAMRANPESTQFKIFPRNLTARAEFLVAGNPVVTRPEDAVANCYPGLELDVRNLDRRFFPGLVFNFVEPTSGDEEDNRYGAKLAYLDASEDPDLQLDQRKNLVDEMKKRGIEIEPVARGLDDLFMGALSDLDTTAGNLSSGSWYLDWIKQGRSKLSMNGLIGVEVWRLVRGLEPGLVTIGLKLHKDSTMTPAQFRKRKRTEVLTGWRRLYTDPITGVINGAYQPGELMQGLCSPWQHDFRDCYCHYWASNRPDLVQGEVYPGEPVLPGGGAVDSTVNIRLDWMRAERSRPLAVGAFGIIEQNRPYQFDHYQINREWQNLNLVLEGREIDSVYLSEPIEFANPYSSAEALAKDLRGWLAPLELTLVFEYLYARFSLRDPEKETIRDVDLSGALLLAREYLLLTAVSEMQHLRWGNEILWELHKAGRIANFQPVLEPSKLVPHGRGGPLKGKKTTETIAAYLHAPHKTRFRPSQLAHNTAAALADFQAIRHNAETGWRPRELRLLNEEVQQDFINLEHPSAFIDGAYARVVATLDQPEYPPHLAQLARRIVADGMQHESRFIMIQAALKPYKEARYLRTKMKVGPAHKVADALHKRDLIIAALHKAYTAAANEDIGESARQIADARGTMRELLEVGEQLASQDFGIPFFPAP